MSCLPVAGLTRLRGPPLPEYSPSLPKAFRTRPLYPRTYLWLVLRASAAHHGRSTHLRFRRLSVHGPCTLVLTCSWTYTPPWPATAGRTSLRFRRPSVQPLAPGRRTVVRRPSLTYMHSHRWLVARPGCAYEGNCTQTRRRGETSVGEPRLVSPVACVSGQISYGTSTPPKRRERATALKLGPCTT